MSHIYNYPNNLPTSSVRLYRFPLSGVRDSSRLNLLLQSAQGDIKAIDKALTDADTFAKSYIGGNTSVESIDELYGFPSESLICHYDLYDPTEALASVPDLSDNGYTLQLGSTSGTDGNDPTWMTDGVGLSFANDDYCTTAALEEVDPSEPITAYLVGKFTGTSGTLWFLGADDDDLNYYALEYDGAGKVRAAVYPTWADTNYCLNPKPLHAAASLPATWTATYAWNSTYTYSNGAVHNSITSKHIKIVGNAGCARLAGVIVRGGVVGDVSEGEDVALSVVLGEAALTGCSLRLELQWQTAAGAFISLDTQAISPGSSFAVHSIVASAPASASKVYGYIKADNNFDEGDIQEYSICQVQVEKAAASPWFDGDSAGCSWTGTEDASTSTRSCVSTELDISSTENVILALEIADNILTLTNISTNESTELVIPSLTGDLIFAIGNYSGLTIGDYVDTLEINEVLFYNRELSNEEKSKVENYLITKWDSRDVTIP